MMYGGELVYSFADAPAVIKFLFDSAPRCAGELNVDMSLVRLPNDQRFLTLDFCYSGGIAAGEKVLAPYRQIRKPIARPRGADALREAAAVRR